MSNELIGRNEPCPCKSGKKYKRCCGTGAAPKLSTPKQKFIEGVPQEEFLGASMDPQVQSQLIQAMQRLPKGQVQRLQAIMQKAFSGKDVSREAEELEKSLPPEVYAMLSSVQLPPQLEAANDAPAAVEQSSAATTQMSEGEARRIVEEAAASGKISKEKADDLLQGAESTQTTEQQTSTESNFSKLWNKIKKK